MAGPGRGLEQLGRRGDPRPFHILRDDAEAGASALRALAGRATLLQSFLPAVLTEGERSLIYLGGAFSHAVAKLPAGGEFRVQEEHGGVITACDPDPASLALADMVIALLDRVPLYPRVDLVRGGGRPLLMELELVEPSLYLRTDPEAPARFAVALDGWIRAAPSLSSRP